MQAEFASASAIGSPINRVKASLFWEAEGVAPRTFDYEPMGPFEYSPFRR